MTAPPPSSTWRWRASPPSRPTTARTAAPAGLLAPPGADACDFGDKLGSGSCSAAVKALAQAASRAQANSNLNHGSGNCGCTARTGTGDWTAHWRGISTVCTGDANYQLVCTGRPGVYVRSTGIQPITGMPSTHPKVTQTICGESLSAGTPIPATGLWSKTGRATAGGDCTSVVSGELFYAQNHPISSSGNIRTRTLPPFI